MSLLGFLTWNVLEDVVEDIEREQEESASYETDNYRYDWEENEESEDSEDDC